MKEQQCICGSSVNEAECCLRVMNEGASTPEQLMRSRYVAFVKKDVDYLLETSHPDFLEPGLKEELEQAFEQNEWLSLRVLDTPLARGGVGYVEFAAYCRQGACAAELHERSKFLCVDGRWLYRGGRILPDYKIGADEPCWCGSRKKLKKCHRI